MFDASLGLLAASSYRLVYGLAIVLALLGVAMIILTVWLVKSTRPDPRVLARLEAMGSRRWWRAGTIGRRQQLEAVTISAADARDDDDGDDPAGQAGADTDDDVNGGQPDETGPAGGASDGLGDTPFDDDTPQKGLGRGSGSADVRS